jgi:hypothetical protein
VEGSSSELEVKYHPKPQYPDEQEDRSNRQEEPQAGKYRHAGPMPAMCTRESLLLSLSISRKQFSHEEWILRERLHFRSFRPRFRSAIHIASTT